MQVITPPNASAGTDLSGISWSEMTRSFIACCLIAALMAQPARFSVAAASKVGDPKAHEESAQTECSGTPALTADETAKVGFATGLEQAILDAAAAFAIPATFFRGLIWQESRFNPNAISPA